MNYISAEPGSLSGHCFQRAWDFRRSERVKVPSSSVSLRVYAPISGLLTFVAVWTRTKTSACEFS